MTVTMAGDINSLERLFQNVLSHHSSLSNPYLVLIQHSRSYRLRRQAVTSVDDAVYRGAGLRTPTENAIRDWQAGSLWLEYLVELLLDDSSHNLVWLQTSPSHRRQRWLQQLPVSGRIKLLEFQSDPFCWNGSGSCHLGDLEDAVSAVEEEVAALVGGRNQNVDARNQDRMKPEAPILLVDSLTAITMRHGFARTIGFLQKLVNIPDCPLVILPVQTETLNSGQHRVLEDLANACIILEGGSSTLLRQGIREKANLLREELQYKIEETNVGPLFKGTGEKRIRLIAKDEESTRLKGPTSGEKGGTEEAVRSVLSLSITGPGVSSQTPAAGGTSRRGKVDLQLDDDSRTKPSHLLGKPSTPQQPQIFVQDDDPEFEDYDEDDDLDL